MTFGEYGPLSPSVIGCARTADSALGESGIQRRAPLFTIGDAIGPWCQAHRTAMEYWQRASKGTREHEYL